MGDYSDLTLELLTKIRNEIFPAFYDAQILDEKVQKWCKAVKLSCAFDEFPIVKFKWLILIPLQKFRESRKKSEDTVFELMCSTLDDCATERFVLLNKEARRKFAMREDGWGDISDAIGKLRLINHQSSRILTNISNDVQNLISKKDFLDTDLNTEFAESEIMKEMDYLNQRKNVLEKLKSTLEHKRMVFPQKKNL